MGKGFEESSPKQTKMALKFMKNVLWRKGKLKLHWYRFSPISWENPKVWEHTLLVRLWANIAVEMQNGPNLLEGNLVLKIYQND